MNLGVHRVEKSANGSAYFVLRSFGNYLVYPDALTSFNKDLFKSRGGVYRQLIHDLNLVSLSQVQLFKTFGASAVIDSKFKGQDIKSMPLEFFGDNFIDPTIKLNMGSWGGNYLMMKQGGEKVVFVSPDHFFSHNDQVFYKENAVTERLFEYFESIGVSYVFFSDHDKGNHYISL